MKKSVTILLKAALFMLLSACVLVFIPIRSNAVNHLILSPFEGKFAKGFQFKSSRIWLPGDITLGEITSSGEGGMTYHAETLRVKYNIAKILSGKRNVWFSVNGITFCKAVGLLDSVSRILAMPQTPGAGFDFISGSLEFRDNAVYIEKIEAVNKDVIVKGSGRIGRDGGLDCDLHFSFSEAIVNTIPEAIKTTLLTKEPGGWMGIALKTTGNYAKPSLCIDSGTFKLNIKESVIKLN